MRKSMTAVALLFVAGAIGMQAQVTSSRRIPIRKDMPASTTSSAGGQLDTLLYTTPDTMFVDTTLTTTYYLPTPTAHCATLDPASLAVAIKTDLYNSATMISPDSAKAIALCAVPGQIGSGEMNVANGITHYAIDIIPNRKKTHTKVLIDAQTGAVLSSKQFGGVRGVTGWVRESAEHKTNKAKAAKDTIPF
jgi:Peptidase propeptide and YPEB domain